MEVCSDSRFGRCSCIAVTWKTGVLSDKFLTGAFNLSDYFFMLAYVKRKCKALRETEFSRKNLVSVARFLNMSLYVNQG